MILGSFYGTGHAGMEAAVASLIEPGETILVGNTGIWGARAAELASRYGGGLRADSILFVRCCEMMGWCAI